MKKFLIFPLFYCGVFLTVYAGYDIKTSSIIDQPAIEVLGDYNGCWYVIGFERPNHPDKPARFYILKYAAGFPTAKSSQVYPPFGEKTDYLKAAIVDKKISVFYSRTEHLPDRPNMVDSRDGYKQIPKILRQDYDPVTLLPTGEPVVIFDESKEHFAASGIDIAQSDDKSKTAILIKHYFRQSRFKLLVIDNITDSVFQRTSELKTGKDLVNFRRMVISNYGRVFLEAKTQFDPLHLNTTSKSIISYYFFSLAPNDEELSTVSKPSPNGENPIAHDPLIACLNVGHGELAIAWDHYAAEHSHILKGVSLIKYDGLLQNADSRELVPDDKIMTHAAPYQTTKSGFECLTSQQIIPLEEDNFVLLMEQQRELMDKDKITQAPIKTTERNYILAYRLAGLQTKAVDFIDKKQSAHTMDYAFSLQALRQKNDIYLFYNEDCSADDERGLYLLGTKLSFTGGEPVTQKIVHTSEDFFTSLAHIYPGPGNRILFTEEKLVDYTTEGRELKLLEVKIK